MTIQSVLDYDIAGNSILNYLTALGIFLAGTVIVIILKNIFLKRLKKRALSSSNARDDFLINALNRSLVPALFLGALYLAANSLTLSEAASRIIYSAGIILVAILAIKAFITGVRLGLQSYLAHSDQAEQKAKQVRGFQVIVEITIWILALIFVLDNLGIKISAVVAGLGIGGIAVALAAQAVLGDLFSYLVIFFDKPFEIGDFIIVGEKMGTVENIGMKTTRIRALGGEQIVFSNTDLTNSRVHNYKKMEKRRVVFNLAIVYQTPLDKLKSITGIVQEIIQEQPDVIFDRGHFAAYGDFSLNFQFVYYINSADYNKYMDTQQAVYLEIFQAFEREGISFAYPTQTVVMGNGEGAKRY